MFIPLILCGINYFISVFYQIYYFPVITRQIDNIFKKNNIVMNSSKPYLLNNHFLFYRRFIKEGMENNKSFQNSRINEDLKKMKKILVYQYGSFIVFIVCGITTAILQSS